jgi:hypothetical protein
MKKEWARIIGASKVTYNNCALRKLMCVAITGRLHPPIRHSREGLRFRRRKETSLGLPDEPLDDYPWAVDGQHVEGVRFASNACRRRRAGLDDNRCPPVGAIPDRGPARIARVQVAREKYVCALRDELGDCARVGSRPRQLSDAAPRRVER